MRTVAGAILIASAAICISIGTVAASGRGEVAVMAAVVPGILGVVLLVKGLKSEGHDSGNNS